MSAEVGAPPRTAGQALADATERLRAAGTDTPRLDAEVLVAHAFDQSRAWLLSHPEQPVPAAVDAALQSWVARRASGEPVAYIRGFKEWFGLRMATDRRALIPRPETELLAAEAIACIAGRLAVDDRPILAWEVGTGSGALAVALAGRFRTALALGRLRLVATDSSAAALALAAENLVGHGLDSLVTFARSDLLEPRGDLAGGPDVVVADLPYLRTDEVAAGTGSLAWEPPEALDGGSDGLRVLGALLVQLPGRLAADGTALLEIGASQADAVRGLVAALAGRWTLSTARDLSGHDRVVRLDRVW